MHSPTGYYFKETLPVISNIRYFYCPNCTIKRYWDMLERVKGISEKADIGEISNTSR